MQPRPALSELITYNVEIVGQALAIAQALEARHADFAAQVGPHLRHIAEHYEALLNGVGGSIVDYDHRSRDRDVESDPALAATRLRAVMDGLEQLRGRRAGGGCGPPSRTGAPAPPPTTCPWASTAAATASISSSWAPRSDANCCSSPVTRFTTSHCSSRRCARPA